MKSAFVLGILITFQLSQATTRDHRQKLVQDYYAKKALMKSPLILALSSRKANHEILADHCSEPGKVGACVDAVCAKLPAYECNDKSEIEVIAGVCANNIDGGCVNAVCGKLPSYDCNDLSELKEVAGMCNLVSGQCVEAVCSRLPSFDCNDMSELKEIARMCRGLLDGECVNSVCAKLPVHDCNDLSELEEIANMCKNPNP